MKKHFIIVLILSLFCLGAVNYKNGSSITTTTDFVGTASTKSEVDGVAISSGCAEDYAPSLTDDLSVDVSEFNEFNEYAGIKYTPDSNDCICFVDMYIAIDGDISSIDFYLRIYTMSGDNLDVAQGTSAKLDGSAMVDSTWISANAGQFTFSPCVDVTNGTAYGFAVFADTDGDPNDDPEVDDTNHLKLRADDENNGDAIQGGNYQWRHSDKTDQFKDAEDDMLIKVSI